MEKNFFSKTKVKIALGTATAMFVAVFLKEILGFDEEILKWLIGVLTTLALSLVGAHTATDMVAVKAKAKMMGGDDSELIRKVAIDLHKAGVTSQPKDPS